MNVHAMFCDAIMTIPKGKIFRPNDVFGKIDSLKKHQVPGFYASVQTLKKKGFVESVERGVYKIVDNTQNAELLARIESLELKLNAIAAAVCASGDNIKSIMMA